MQVMPRFLILIEELGNKKKQPLRTEAGRAPLASPSSYLI